MHRFYVPNIAFPAIDLTGSDSAKRSLTLDGQLARQLKTVLRVGIGDRIGLFDGSGLEWEVQIDQVDRTEVAVRLISTVESVPEPFARVTMLLGLARPERIELAIQKCTELGAVRFIPVLSERVRGGSYRCAIGQQARPLAEDRH
jgi:RsmE family RNA methyltransferase